MQLLNHKTSSSRKLCPPRSRHGSLRSHFKGSRLAKAPASASFAKSSDYTESHKPFQATRSTQDSCERDAPIEITGGPLRIAFLSRWYRFLAWKHSFPPYLFATITIISLFVVGTLLTGTLLATRGNKSRQSPALPPPPPPPIVDLQEEEDNAAFDTVTNFLNSRTIANKINLIRHPEKIGPSLEEYYNTAAITLPERTDFINNAFNVIRGDVDTMRSVVLITPKNENNTNSIFFLEHIAPKKYLIDWEASNALLHTDLKGFKNRRPTTDELLRIWVTPDDYYNYGYSEDEYLCVKISHRLEPDVTLYGYARIGSEEEAILYSLYPATSSFRGSMAVTLNLRYSPDSRSPDHVEISEILSTNWMLPDSYY